MDLQITILQITPDMVGKNLMIRGASVQHMFAEDAFGATAVAGAAPASAPESQQAQYEIPPGMANADAVLDWIVRFITEAKGRKLTITDLRDALPEVLINLYASAASARGSVPTAVKKGVDSGVLVAEGYGASDVVKKAPRKRKVKSAEEGGQGDADPQNDSGQNEERNDDQASGDQASDDQNGGDGDDNADDFVAPKAPEAQAAEKPAVTTAPAGIVEPVASSKAPGSERSASDRDDINEGIQSFHVD